MPSSDSLAEELDLSRDNLSARIYERLRLELMTGLHEPGSRISIRRMAAQLNTSATPVREAIFQLIREGALELRPGFQPRVPVLALDEYINIRDTRAPLERAAAELAAVHVTEEDLRQLALFHDRYADGCRNRLWRDAVVANQAFHFTIYRATRNPVLIRVIEGLWLLAGPFVAQQFPRYAQEPTDLHPHLMIIDALRRRSPAEAGDLVVRDLREGSERIIARLGEAPPPKRRRARRAAE